ncbi:MAG: YkgJ family cysteine cluster protein [Deltaproteobacteria bacterium]|nr:YkgJ family cysteine cluster protein [Deltaproteobacteria bacterium]
MTQPEPRAARTLAGARWACGACGDCCRHFQLGPVEPEIIAGLAARPLAAEFPQLAGRPFFKLVEGPAGPAHFLEKNNGACVFLEADNRCGVHRRWGAAAKPAFCRAFPVHLVDDPRGRAAVARPHCTGLAAGQRAGAPMDEVAAEAADLPRALPIPRFAPQAVALLPGLGVSLDDWMQLEDHLIGLLDGPPAPLGALLARLRAAALGAVRRPDPGSDAARAAAAFGAVLEGERLVLRAAIAAGGAPSAAEAEFAARLAADLDRAAARLPQGPPALDEEAMALCARILQGELLSKRAHAEGSVAAGLGRAAHALWVAALAAAEGEAPVGVDALMARLSPHLRLGDNGQVAALLQRARPALIDLFLFAGAAPW